MKATRSLGRPILLVALFAIGVLLILHIGRSLTPPDRGQAPIASAAKSAVGKPPIEEPSVKSQPSASKKAVLPPDLHTEGIHKSRGRLVATNPILFNSGLSTLRETSIPELNRIAEYLNKNPNLRLEIVGYTDNLGPESVNQQVSAERARLVKEYLVSQGIDPSRLETKGMGSLNPVESNDTQLGRQANRRIEFMITGESLRAQVKE
jgi:outer membrane protein OmpA-like peptidoglycan-associated protein